METTYTFHIFNRLYEMYILGIILPFLGFGGEKRDCDD